MKTVDEILESVELQKKVCEWESLITTNLKSLAQALQIASENRFMSHEHAKTVWKSYLIVSGMDVPKDLKEKVIGIIDKKENK